MTEKDFNLFIADIRVRLIAFARPFIPEGSAITQEDLVQEAAVKVWMEINEKNVKIRNLEAFTIAVLKNVCIDFKRLKKNQPGDVDQKRLYLSKADSDPHKSLEIKESVRRVEKIMKGLSLDQQMVLRLREIMGYEFSEISEILNMSEGNVRTILSRTRREIRNRLIER